MENLEVRVVSTGKGYRVEQLEIGANMRTTVKGGLNYGAAVGYGRRHSALQRASRKYGYVRLMIEEVF